MNDTHKLTDEEIERCRSGAKRGLGRYLRWCEKVREIKSPYARVIAALDYYKDGLTPLTVQGALLIKRADAAVLLERSAEDHLSVRISRPDPGSVTRGDIRSRIVYVAQCHKNDLFKKIEEAY